MASGKSCSSALPQAGEGVGFLAAVCAHKAEEPAKSGKAAHKQCTRMLPKPQKKYLPPGKACGESNETGRLSSLQPHLLAAAANSATCERERIKRAVRPPVQTSRPPHSNSRGHEYACGKPSVKCAKGSARTPRARVNPQGPRRKVCPASPSDRAVQPERAQCALQGFGFRFRAGSIGLQSVPSLTPNPPTPVLKNKKGRCTGKA